METRDASYWTSGFADRREAGQLLALATEERGVLDGEQPVVVVGLARGGVEVAAEVAERIGAPLDALAVRKVGHPWQPEYGLGAVTPDGTLFLRSRDGLTEAQVGAAIERAVDEAAVLDRRLHSSRGALPLEGATCVLVDDGLATGGTMVAAARWARVHQASRVVVAVPVGAALTVRSLADSEDVDDVVCLAAPPDFGAVGFWYRNFHQVEDERVISLLDEAHERTLTVRSIEIPAGSVSLTGDVAVPALPIGWVVFAHGSGSSRLSSRNRRVAGVLQRAGVGTLLFDLLTPAEELDRRNVFDIELLATRLEQATGWLDEQPGAAGAALGYFGASTGAAAALVAAVELGSRISAVVSRGGRPDLAADRLGEVTAPTLLIVGGADEAVLDLNRAAAKLLRCRQELAVVPGATHLFEEPGALDQVAELARTWFTTSFEESRTQPAPH